MNNPEYAQALRDLNTLHCRDLQSHFALRGENRVAAQLALANAINKSKSAVVVKKVSYSAVHPPRQLKFSVHAGKETTNEASHMQTNGPNHLRYYGWQEGVGLPSVADEKALREIGFLKLRQRAQNYQEWTSGASARDPSRTVDAVIAQDALDMILALKNIVKTRGLVDFTEATDLAQNFSVLVQTNGSKLDKKELKAIYTLVMQIVNGDDGIIDAVKPPVKDLTAIGGVLTASGQTIADILRTKGDDVPPQELGTFNAPEVVQKEHDEMGAEGRAEAVAKEERKEDAQAEGTVDLEPEPVNPTAAVPAPGAAPIPVPAGAPIAPHGLPPPVAPIRIPGRPTTPGEEAPKDWAFESEEDKDGEGEHMYTPTARNASAASLSGLPMPQPARPVDTAAQAAAHAASAMQAAEAPRIGAEAAAAQEAAVPTTSFAADVVNQHAAADAAAAEGARSIAAPTATAPSTPTPPPLPASPIAMSARSKKTYGSKREKSEADKPKNNPKVRASKRDLAVKEAIEDIEKKIPGSVTDGSAIAGRMSTVQKTLKKAATKRIEKLPQFAVGTKTKRPDGRAAVKTKPKNTNADMAERMSASAANKRRQTTKAKRASSVSGPVTEDIDEGSGKPRRKGGKRAKKPKAKGGSKRTRVAKGKPAKKRVYKKGA